MTIEDHLSAIVGEARNRPHPLRYQSLLKAAAVLVEEAGDSISGVAPPSRCAEHLLLAARLEEMSSTTKHLEKE